MMLRTVPEGAHIPKSVAIKSFDVAETIRGNAEKDPDAIIVRIGYGRLSVYRNTVGTRKLMLDSDNIPVFFNGVIYRLVKQFDAADWYVLKLWYRDADGNLRLQTYAANDVHNATPINLMEVYQ